MSGHSKWASIKHKKGKLDAQRGKLFGRLIKEIAVAARMGGGDVEANPRLRTAVATAKAANMPNENIERAIKRGTGDLPGVTYEEGTYEGYAQAGVAFMVEVLTDNKNRSNSELRKILSKLGGHMGEPGCVAWQFETKGFITVSASDASEDALMEICLEAGAEDIQGEDGLFSIITTPEAFEAVTEAITAAGVATQSAELTKLAKDSVPVDVKDAGKVLRLIEALEDWDDAQHVYSNFDIADDVLEKISSE